MHLLARVVIIASLLTFSLASQSFAEGHTEGFGATCQEAVDMAKENANDIIKSRGGEGCLGKKDGTLIRSSEMKDGMCHVTIYWSKNAGSCGQHMNKIKILGQDVNL